MPLGNVFKLNKALYGLKQAARSWFEFLSDILRNSSFTQLTADPCIFIDRGRKAVIAVYVDDILLACPNINTADKIFKELSNYFELTRKQDDSIKHFLGLTIHCNENIIAIEQTN